MKPKVVTIFDTIWSSFHRDISWGLEFTTITTFPSL